MLSYMPSRSLFADRRSLERKEVSGGAAEEDAQKEGKNQAVQVPGPGHSAMCARAPSVGPAGGRICEKAEVCDPAGAHGIAPARTSERLEAAWGAFDVPTSEQRGVALSTAFFVILFP